MARKSAAERREEIVLSGEVPSPLKPPPGCHFHPRCPYAMERCKQEAPELALVEGRLVSCHLYAQEGSERVSSTIGDGSLEALLGARPANSWA